MANFLVNFVSLMGVPVFYFQNLVTLLLSEYRALHSTIYSSRISYFAHCVRVFCSIIRYQEFWLSMPCTVPCMSTDFLEEHVSSLRVGASHGPTKNPS
jgi:hypothetical protein